MPAQLVYIDLEIDEGASRAHLSCLDEGRDKLTGFRTKKIYSVDGLGISRKGTKA